MTFLEYITTNSLQIIALLYEHIKLTSISVGAAIILGVPLGILITYAARLSKPVLMAANVVQAVPSMALFGFMIPFLGIGALPAIVAVILYSLLPIVKNTYTGLNTISPQTLETAKGIGLTPFQVLTKVQIPLALPVIMTGVRVASVTSVGLMTIAAFIGAGGLGYLVFSGISTVNNYQILAGAIPACLLALSVDFIFGVFEKLVTPISMQKGETAAKRKKQTMQKIILVSTVVVISSMFIITSLRSEKRNERSITVGTKEFSEQRILGNMVAELIEAKTDISVERKIGLGGTQVCFGALRKGDIDMYIEYTGTAYTDMLKHPPISDMHKVYTVIQKEMKENFDMEILAQMNFNNTYTLAVQQADADKHKLETISDLKNIAKNMSSGTTFEFSNRQDGLQGLEKAYAFNFGNKLTIDGSSRYIALMNGKVDVVDAFSTDGLLKKFQLKTLVDDKNFFPPYFAVPLIRADTLAKYPEIAPILEELGNKLSNETMIELNYQVDELLESPSKVAHDFLEANGLL